MMHTLRYLFTGSSVSLIGLLFVAVTLFWYGPYLGFGSFYPLQSLLARIILVVAIFAVYGTIVLLRRRKAAKADEQLADDLVESADTDAGGVEAMSGDEVALLKERFEEAIGTLRDSSGKRRQASLYELPWYVIIGPPGSGKTTALVNSGLEFPLEQRFGKESLRGVGGTRNCDWWFTNEAVLLDTAGRYVTQDSHQAVDSAAWEGFLDLLKKYRKRRPINGVLVAMSLSDLLTQSEAERNAHVMAIRQRIQELYKHFGIRFPVYMLFTKCDLVAGFIEFFDDLDQVGREQVWGATFDLESKRGAAEADGIESFSAELDLLMQRLTERMSWRMSQERDLARRAKIYGFPQQLIALSATMDSFLRDVFSSSRFDDPVLLRGVYFTSGVQEGTPIDRMMSVMAKTFGVVEQALPSFGGRGRSYFITDLFRKVVFQESGLAGVNPRIERRRRVLQASAYVGSIVLAAAAGFAWITSYNANRAYLGEVDEALALYQQLPTPRSGELQTLDEVLPRLDALRNVLDVAGRHEDDVPLHMGMWLYQGDAMTERVADAYRRELNETLGPVVMAILEDRIRENAGNPQLLYEYLKAYMMLGNPERMESRQLSFLIAAEWRRSFAGDGEKYARLKKHSDFLFQQTIPYPVNERLISGAQATLAQSPLSEFLYSRLKLDALEYEQQDLVLTQRLGLGLEKVYRRKSRVPLSEPVSVLYTSDGFKKLYPALSSRLIAEAGKENWVLGRDEGGLSVSKIAEVEAQLREKYIRDYIATWNSLLNDLEIVPFGGEAQAMEVLDLIAAKPSVMHELLLVVADNTNLSEPPPEEGEGEATGGQSRLSRLFGGESDPSSLLPGNPGDPITREFARLNRVVTGQPASIEQLLLLVDDLQREVEDTGAGGDVLGVIARGGGPAARRVRTEARRQPEPLKSWLTSLGGRSEALAAGNVMTQLSNEYGNTVVAECRRLINGRYPFDRNSQEDVALNDFARVFGYGGVLDSFFEENLAPVVDRSGSVWRVRQGASLQISADLLRQFQLAERIRQTYFRAGSQDPEVSFIMTPARLDSEVQRFVFETNGQSLVYQHGPQRPTTIRWPGDGPGSARVMFEEASGGRPTVVEDGPWALFRLFDASDLRQISEIKYEMDISAGPRTATVGIETRSVTNPFSGPKLYEFRCRDSL